MPLAPYTGRYHFKCSDLGTWTRYCIDEPERDRQSDGGMGGTFCACKGDVSPNHPIYTAYDSACGWCWLGASHSSDVHQERVGGRKVEGGK